METVLRQVVDTLKSHRAAWALVGGLAVSARAEPRFTRDIDIAVSVRDDSDAESFVAALRECGYRVVKQIEQTRANRLATVRLSPPAKTASPVTVDLLFASSGIEPEVVRRATRIEALPGLRLPVARVGHLIAMKVLARDDETRPQDRADLLALLRVATLAETKRAEAALREIARRAYHRGKDLLAEFREIRAVVEGGSGTNR